MAIRLHLSGLEWWYPVEPPLKIWANNLNDRNKVEIRIFDENAGVNTLFDTEPLVTDGEWKFVVATYGGRLGTESNGAARFKGRMAGGPLGPFFTH